jgi:hypothetical protein
VENPGRKVKKLVSHVHCLVSSLRD